MTAIYGYVSAQKKRAILVADDLEGGNKRQVDKVFRIGSRFICGVHGSDLSIHVAGTLSGRVFAEIEKVESIGEITERFLESLPIVISGIWPAYLKAKKAGQITESAWSAVQVNPICLTILDCERYVGIDVNFGAPFPPGSIYAVPIVVPLVQESLLRFALAKQMPSPTIDYGEDAISTVIQDLDSKVGVDSANFPGFVGLPGASCSTDSGVRNDRSVFRTTQEAVRAMYSFEHLGFIINVFPA